MKKNVSKVTSQIEKYTLLQTKKPKKSSFFQTTCLVVSQPRAQRNIINYNWIQQWLGHYHHSQPPNASKRCPCKISQPHSVCHCQISQKHPTCHCEISQRQTTCRCKILQRHGHWVTIVIESWKWWLRIKDDKNTLPLWLQIDCYFGQVEMAQICDSCTVVHILTCYCDGNYLAVVTHEKRERARRGTHKTDAQEWKTKNDHV